jgi:effector-binding domain-containing protein
MLDAPEITHTTPQLTAVIHVTIPRAKIREVMGPGIAELRAAVAAQGVATTGPWFTHHLRMDSDRFDFEIGVPVAAPVAPAGRMKPGEWPAMKVARTVHHGGYEDLPAAWGEFNKWVAANGHRPTPDLWEQYVTDPSSSPDQATWRTELQRPLID